MNSVVSFDKVQDEVGLIESDSTNKFFAKRFVKGKFTMKQILVCVFVALVICVVVLIHPEKCSCSSFQVANATNVPDFVSTTEATLIPFTKEQLEERQQFVREMMLDSWSAYEQYAWGYDELKPVTHYTNYKDYSYYKNYSNDRDYSYLAPQERLSGLTLVSSMSTLWTMGLKEQFEKGKKWIESELDFTKLDRNNDRFAVHDLIVHYVGGLLSCYALTGDRMFLNKAKEIGQLVKPAFDIPTGLRSKTLSPDLHGNGLKYKSPNEHVSVSVGIVFYQEIPLAYLSGLQLDLNYLSDASGDVQFRKYSTQIQKLLNESPDHYLDWIKDKYIQFILGLSLCTDSCEMFSSLVKVYIQSNYRTGQSLKMYNDALNAVDEMNMFDIFPNKLHYTRGYDNITKKYDTFMRYSSCCVGAMLAIGANAINVDFNNSIDQNAQLNNQCNRYSKLFKEKLIRNERLMAEQITKTCQQASNETATGLAPHKFFYDRNTQHVVEEEEYYYLSHELAESNFILWRLTHQSEYREDAWKMAQAIHKHCRVETGGYSGVNNVNQVPTTQNDHQPSIFLSATLKYLYLTFTDDTVLPLDQFVFNSVGHPLPICGNNTMYPKELCNN